MSWHHVKPSSKRRHAPHLATAAVAAIVLAALGACTSTPSASTTGSPASALATASAIPPISGYSWALVYTRQRDQATGQALVAMLDWLTHAGQAYAAPNGYVPLPAQIRQLARTTLQRITGPSGTSLLS